MKQALKWTITSALYILLTLLIAHCSNTANNEELTLRGPAPGPKNFNVGQCSQNPAEGSTLSTQSFSNKLKQTEYFNKKFYPSQFKTSLSASSLSIAETLRLQGVYIYQMVEDESSPCRYFDFLNNPTQKAQDSWDNHKQPGEENSVLLGLFTTYYLKNQKTLAVKMSQPTIMLRHDTQKWTLLHEMSHFLFAKGRATKNNMPFSENLEKQIRVAKRKIINLEKKYQNIPSQNLAGNIVKQYQSFFQLNYLLDARGALEEFTVESQLAEQARAGRISFITASDDLKNAYRYMITNSNLITPSYVKLYYQLENLDDQVFSNQWPKVSKNIQKIKDEIKSLLSFIDEKLTAAKGEDFSNALFSESVHKIQNPMHTYHFDLKKMKARHSLFNSWDSN